MVDFKVNQEVITTTLCINKDKPITICGGSCYLDKELNKTEEPQEAGVPGSLKVKVEVDYVITDGDEHELAFIEEIITDNFKTTQSTHSSSHLDEIFRPPRIS